MIAHRRKRRSQNRAVIDVSGIIDWGCHTWEKNRGVFGYMVVAATDQVAEVHHGDYEGYIQYITDTSTYRQRSIHTSCLKVHSMM